MLPDRSRMNTSDDEAGVTPVTVRLLAARLFSVFVSPGSCRATTSRL